MLSGQRMRLEVEDGHLKGNDNIDTATHTLIVKCLSCLCQYNTVRIGSFALFTGQITK